MSYVVRDLIFALWPEKIKQIILLKFERNNPQFIIRRSYYMNIIREQKK